MQGKTISALDHVHTQIFRDKIFKQKSSPTFTGKRSPVVVNKVLSPSRYHGVSAGQSKVTPRVVAAVSVSRNTAAGKVAGVPPAKTVNTLSTVLRKPEPKKAVLTLPKATENEKKPILRSVSTSIPKAPVSILKTKATENKEIKKGRKRLNPPTQDDYEGMVYKDAMRELKVGIKPHDREIKKTPKNIVQKLDTTKNTSKLELKKAAAAVVMEPALKKEILKVAMGQKKLKKIEKRRSEEKRRPTVEGKLVQPKKIFSKQRKERSLSRKK